MKVARRNFLSMLAAVPFMSSFENLAGQCVQADPDVRKNFYVWIHGIFGITLQSSQILLISPKMITDDNRHLYKVGRATGYDPSAAQINKNPYCGTQDLAGEGTYLIDGLGPLVPPSQQFSLDQRDILNVTGTAQPNILDTFYFVLPYPKKLIPLRLFNTGIQAEGPTPTNDPRLPNPGSVPLLHVFEYENVSPDKVQILQGGPGGSVFLKPGQSSHLHIYAEPDPACYEASAQCKHDPVVSFQKLQGRYTGLPTFRVQNNEAECVRLSNILSIASDLREQFGLFEWFGQCQESFQPVVNPSTAQPTRGTMDCPQELVIESSMTFKAVRRAKLRVDARMKALNAELDKKASEEFHAIQAAKRLKLHNKPTKQTK
jgi:hypothetical protein